MGDEIYAYAFGAYQAHNELDALKQNFGCFVKQQVGFVKEKDQLGFFQVAHFGQLLKQLREHPQQKRGIQARVLQQAVGGVPFNNLYADCARGPDGPPAIDYAAHAASLGAVAENVKSVPELEAALARARAADRTYVVCIETDPARTTAEGGAWWEVAVPEVSGRAEVRAARAQYVEDKRKQRP